MVIYSIYYIYSITLKLFFFRLFLPYVNLFQVARNASNTRKDSLLSEYITGIVPDQDLLGYHRKCYQSYTNKNSLKKIADGVSGNTVRKSIRDKGSASR